MKRNQSRRLPSPKRDALDELMKVIKQSGAVLTLNGQPIESAEELRTRALTSFADRMRDSDRCFKAYCKSGIYTWEHNSTETPALNGLCREHARRPDRVGTFGRPTLVS